MGGGEGEEGWEGGGEEGWEGEGYDLRIGRGGLTTILQKVSIHRYQSCSFMTDALGLSLLLTESRSKAKQTL